MSNIELESSRINPPKGQVLTNKGGHSRDFHSNQDHIQQDLKKRAEQFRREEYEKLKKSLAHQRNEARKQKRRRDKEEQERLLRRKNADLWNSLKVASQLSSAQAEEPTSSKNLSVNPFS